MYCVIMLVQDRERPSQTARALNGTDLGATDILQISVATNSTAYRLGIPK